MPFSLTTHIYRYIDIYSRPTTTSFPARHGWRGGGTVSALLSLSHSLYLLAATLARPLLPGRLSSAATIHTPAQIPLVPATSPSSVVCMYPSQPPPLYVPSSSPRLFSTYSCSDRENAVCACACLSAFLCVQRDDRTTAQTPALFFPLLYCFRSLLLLDLSFFVRPLVAHRRPGTLTSLKCCLL